MNFREEKRREEKRREEKRREEKRREEKRSNCASVKDKYVPARLLCEYTSTPLGIDVTQPRFSWMINHSERGQLQSAYQVLVASKRENLDTDNADKWDSGKVASGQSLNVFYGGSPLESRGDYYWKVRVWDKDGKVSSWSKIATFEMGLLKSDNWKGGWIKGGNLLRKEFTVGKDIKRVRAYVYGLGYYEMRINGEKIGDHVLDPGWTDYEKRTLYATYKKYSDLHKKIEAFLPATVSEDKKKEMEKEFTAMFATSSQTSNTL